MGNDKVVSLAAPAVVEDALTELLRTGARRLIEAAVAAEFEECLSGCSDERLPDGRRRVVRNGHPPRREIVTGIGAVEVEVPKLRSRSGSSARFALPRCRLTFAAVRVSTPRFRGCTCTGCRRVGCARRCRRWWARKRLAGCRRTW